MDKGTILGLGLIGAGIWMVIDGIRLRQGTHKSWFYVHRTPTIVMPNMMFGAIPAGLAIVSLGFLVLAGRYGWIGEPASLFWINCIVAPLLILGLAFWLWKPRFMQPDWYRWLDEHYGRIMSVLKKDAERLGKAWLDRVRTQEGLEQWAESVRQRVEAERQSKGPLYKNR